jgi:hypothetical protein
MHVIGRNVNFPVKGPFQWRLYLNHSPPFSQPVHMNSLVSGYLFKGRRENTGFTPLTIISVLSN